MQPAAMAVIVFFGNGIVQSYDRATGAHVRGHDFVLTRWNGTLRTPETLDTFDARTVINAEVYTAESPVKIVEGRYLPPE